MNKEITEIRIPNDIDYKIIPSKEWEETEEQIRKAQNELELYKSLLDCFEKEGQIISHPTGQSEYTNVVRINGKELKNFFGVNEIYIEYGEKPNE